MCRGNGRVITGHVPAYFIVPGRAGCISLVDVGDAGAVVQAAAGSQVIILQRAGDHIDAFRLRRESPAAEAEHVVGLEAHGAVGAFERSDSHHEQAVDPIVLLRLEEGILDPDEGSPGDQLQISQRDAAGFAHVQTPALIIRIGGDTLILDDPADRVFTKSRRDADRFSF